MSALAATRPRPHRDLQRSSLASPDLQVNGNGIDLAVEATASCSTGAASPRSDRGAPPATGRWLPTSTTAAGWSATSSEKGRKFDTFTAHSRMRRRTADSTKLRGQLVAELERRKLIQNERVRDAFLAVPRELFVPDFALVRVSRPSTATRRS